MSKKTVSVGRLLEKANNTLANSVPELVEYRKGIASFISDVLHETGNYKGFGYLPSETNIHGGFYGESGRVCFFVAENLRADYEKAANERKNS